MEAIQERPKQSQRELAEKLDLSLGLVNKIINELSSKGLLDTGNSEKNKIQYTLTTKGAARHSDLNKQDLLNQIEGYKRIKKVVGQGLAQFKDLAGSCCILLYGAGALCEIACMLFSQTNTSCEIKVIDDLKAGNWLNGYKIYKESEMNKMIYDSIIITRLDGNGSIYRKLAAKGIPSNKIFTII